MTSCKGNVVQAVLQAIGRCDEHARTLRQLPPDAESLRERALDALIVDVRSLKPAPDLHEAQLVETEGAFLCRPGHPLAALAQVTAQQLLAYPVASTPLSDELARILVERYGEHAHPQQMVTLLSDEISHLVALAQDSDAVVLAIRAAAPQLVALPLTPALDARARRIAVEIVGNLALAA